MIGACGNFVPATKCSYPDRWKSNAMTIKKSASEKQDGSLLSFADAAPFFFAFLILFFLPLSQAQAAPAFQAAGTTVSATGAVSPAWPTHAVDDVALLFVESAGGEPATLSTPAGFVAVANSPKATGTTTNGTQITVFWARATSAAMTAPTVADLGDHVYAQIITYRGVINTGNPWDITGGGVKAAASNSVTVTGVTTTVPDTLIVQAVARDNDSAAVAFSAQANANLTNITERTDAGTTSGNGGGFVVWDGGKETAGATGNTTATVTSSINAFLTIALSPAPLAPPLAEYRMDESAWSGTAGEVKDGSGSYNGTAASLSATKPGTAGVSPAIVGSPGTCRYGVFNRTNKDYVALPSFPNQGAQSFTITAWIKTTDNTQPGQRILIDDENDSGGYGFSLGDGGTGMVRFFSRGTPSALTLDTANVIANNTWYFVAAVADIPSKLKSIYVYNTAGTQLAKVSAVWTEASFGSDVGVASIGGETNAAIENNNAFGFAGNLDEVRVYQSALSAYQVNQVRQATHACGGVDHYELTLPTSGIACLASTVTVTGCANSSSPCTSPSTILNGQTATVATSGGTLGSTTVTFNAAGVASTTLSYPTLAVDGTVMSVTLSGETAAAINPRKCCPDGANCVAANSCSTTFNTAGFIFSDAANGAALTIPTQVAGTSDGTHYLRSVRTNTTTKACEAGLTGANTPVDFSYECNNPATCYSSNLMSLNGGTATTIARNDNGSVTTYTPVNLNFDVNGNAPFSFIYSDVGQVKLYARKTLTADFTKVPPVTAATLVGVSNAFVVKPYGFVLSAIKQTAAPNLANPGAVDAAGAKFVMAGESFSATVKAVTSTGSTAYNYGRENLHLPAPGNVPEGVRLTSNLVSGLGLTNNPALTNNNAFGSFSNGVATGTTFRWDEAGIITLLPSVGDADYLGVGDVTGTASGNVGRFYAAKFGLSAGSITNRSDLCPNPPAVQPVGCPATFTYAGEPMNALFTLTAQSVGGMMLQNYNYSSTAANNFAKLNPMAAVTAGTGGPLGLGAVNSAATRTPFPPCGVIPAHPCMTPGQATSGSFSGGAANIALPFNLYRDPTAPSGPYAALDVGIAPQDADGALMAAYDLDTVNVVAGTNNHTKIGNTEIRYGRIALSNAHGSELLDLPVTMTAQYWNGSWIRNMEDTGTSGVTLALTDVTLTDGLVPSETCVFDSGNPGVSGIGCSTAGIAPKRFIEPPVGADFRLWLKAPGAGNWGALNLTATVPAWLRFNWKGAGDVNPSARVTFGVNAAKKSPIIYLRENY